MILASLRNTIANKVKRRLLSELSFLKGIITNKRKPTTPFEVNVRASSPSTTKWGFGNGVGKPTLNQLKMDDVQVMLGSRSVVCSQVGPSIRFRLYTHTDFEFCTPWEQAGGGGGGDREGACRTNAEVTMSRTLVIHHRCTVDSAFNFEFYKVFKRVRAIRN